VSWTNMLENELPRIDRITSCTIKTPVNITPLQKQSQAE